MVTIYEGSQPRRSVKTIHKLKKGGRRFFESKSPTPTPCCQKGDRKGWGPRSLSLVVCYSCDAWFCKKEGHIIEGSQFSPTFTPDRHKTGFFTFTSGKKIYGIPTGNWDETRIFEMDSEGYKGRWITAEYNEDWVEESSNLFVGIEQTKLISFENYGFLFDPLRVRFVAFQVVVEDEKATINTLLIDDYMISEFCWGKKCDPNNRRKHSWDSKFIAMGRRDGNVQLLLLTKKLKLYTVVFDVESHKLILWNQGILKTDRMWNELSFNGTV